MWSADATPREEEQWREPVPRPAAGQRVAQPHQRDRRRGVVEQPAGVEHLRRASAQHHRADRDDDEGGARHGEHRGTSPRRTWGRGCHGGSLPHADPGGKGWDPHRRGAAFPRSGGPRPHPVPRACRLPAVPRVPQAHLEGPPWAPGEGSHHVDAHTGCCAIPWPAPLGGRAFVLGPGAHLAHRRDRRDGPAVLRPDRRGDPTAGRRRGPDRGGDRHGAAGAAGRHRRARGHQPADADRQRAVRGRSPRSPRIGPGLHPCRGR
jgi:hypothetical protein